MSLVQDGIDSCGKVTLNILCQCFPTSVQQNIVSGSAWNKYINILKYRETFQIFLEISRHSPPPLSHVFVFWSVNILVGRGSPEYEKLF
jgi:hypothetical protein